MDGAVVSGGIVSEHFTLDLEGHDVLYCDARYPREIDGPHPVAIFVHGFKGFKDWGFNPYVCESLAQRGFYTVAFNFSHNGTEGHGTEFTRLDRFAENTPSREIAELLGVIDAVVGLRVPHFEHIDNQRIGLVGHSRGGGISLVAASRQQAVKAVSVWSAVATFDRFTPRQKKVWRAEGSIESRNMRTGQDMRLGLALLNDIELHKAELDILDAARRLARPLLVVHGEQDLSVRIDEGRKIVEAADVNLTEFEAVPHAGHTYGAVHPFEGSTPSLERAIDRTAHFLARHLVARTTA